MPQTASTRALQALRRQQDLLKERESKLQAEADDLQNSIREAENRINLGKKEQIELQEQMQQLEVSGNKRFGTFVASSVNHSSSFFNNIFIF